MYRCTFQISSKGIVPLLLKDNDKVHVKHEGDDIYHSEYTCTSTCVHRDLLLFWKLSNTHCLHIHCGSEISRTLSPKIKFSSKDWIYCSCIDSLSNTNPFITLTRVS